MANFIVTYDLNGPRPSHREMDRHLEELGATRGRLLETVWYVGCQGTASELRDYVKSILGPEDLLLVVEATDAAWTKTLLEKRSLIDAWEQNRRR